MAGVSDRVFRTLCREHGADYAPSEMTSADPRLRATPQTRRRLAVAGEPSPRIVQIAGADPREMAQAARECVADGAEIVDINMGCPAKRVCNRLAGSALLRDEVLVGDILAAVVRAVSVPVTLKTRTGWSRAARNATRVARIAEDSGIALLTLHGRTRECAYAGDAEYDTIAEVKASVRMPVIANGDITSPEKARVVLAHTGADGLMIGRAAQGDPWLFARIRAWLDEGRVLPPPAPHTVLATLRRHVAALHDFYGEVPGVRIARKHAGWYQRWLPQGATFRAVFNSLETAVAQLAFIDRHAGAQQGEAA
jgi:tRNA-dihydrouridine synthase B